MNASAWQILFRYCFEVALAFDRLLNAIICGKSTETICVRATQAWFLDKTWGCVLCRVVDFFDRDHCVTSGVAKFGPIFAEIETRRNPHFSDHPEALCTYTMLFALVAVRWVS
jgi:hypothetical protein